MKLITEEIQNAEYIVEQNNGKKDYKIKGIFMQAEMKNKNGRVYPKDVLTREVARYNREFINKSRAFGELGHPDGPTVNLERVSHMIKALYPEGNNFIGEAKILDTPYGIDEGAKLGVSSRGMGTLTNRGGANVVSDDFYLATAADIVADPSAPEAFVEGIMEGKDWVWDNGVIKEQDVNRLKLEMSDAKRHELAEKQAKVFESFIKNL